MCVRGASDHQAQGRVCGHPTLFPTVVQCPLCPTFPCGVGNGLLVASLGWPSGSERGDQLPSCEEWGVEHPWGPLLGSPRGL